MSIKQFLTDASEIGLKLPYAYDGVKKQPSVTLLMMYGANLLAGLSIIYLNLKAPGLGATTITCMYSITCTALYMMRSLSKAKFDLKDQSIDLESDEDKK